ncbi:hypothetical protein EYF80_042874 [Liparis tanakae]|uniref:Uncharacterized protein n=1 Tax=Liparis tanakae TaxID=230148 RepID=A0A4Z2G024_9TELE|nr:hypothetical protein EYF80_042874 [Liparis tanakae]
MDTNQYTVTTAPIFTARKTKVSPPPGPPGSAASEPASAILKMPERFSCVLFMAAGAGGEEEGNASETAAATRAAAELQDTTRYKHYDFRQQRSRGYFRFTFYGRLWTQNLLEIYLSGGE